MMRVAALSLIGAVYATETEVNPIRRIVNLLQDMQKEVTAEGEQEDELYEKFMCQCKGNTEQMEKEGEAARQEAEAQNAKGKADAAEKATLEQELADHKTDRADARASLKKATNIRAKEAEAFQSAHGEATNDLKACDTAVEALSKGMGASFLQAPVVNRLTALVQKSNLSSDDNETMVAFLDTSSGGDYHSVSGEIVGILKQMSDDFQKEIREGNEGETAAKKAFADLKAAKEEEVRAASSAIEKKTEKVGQLAVAVVTAQAAAKDAQREADDAAQFLADLEKNCAQKTKDHEKTSKDRADELSAISAAIGVLNDDDALDIFKATLPTPPAPPVQLGAPAAFLQRRVSKNNKLVKARTILAGLKGTSPVLSLLAHTVVSHLKAKKVDFSKVLKMIDDMVQLLKDEGKNDEEKRDFCNKELESSADSKKENENKVASLSSAIASMKEEISGLASDVKTLGAENAALDKAVAAATTQRKSENKAFTDQQTMNNAAVMLIEKAKNKLNKFYNPAMYKAPKMREPTEEERLAIAAGEKVDLRAAPEFIPGTTQTVLMQKSKKSGGVIALMDKMKNDLKMEMKDAEHSESDAQKEYDDLLADSAATRSQNEKSMQNKKSAKAGLETEKAAAEEEHSATESALSLVNQRILELHSDCDFLLQNFDARRDAREMEVEGLKNAKAVLSGADFS